MKKKITVLLTLVFLSSSGITYGLTFDDISIDDIMAATLATTPVDGSDNDNNQLLPDSILLYQTGNDRYGKLQILTYGYDLEFRFVTYDDSNDGSVYLQKNDGFVRGTWSYDLDAGTMGAGADFWWEQVTSTERYLVPKWGAEFTVYSSDSPVPEPTTMLLLATGLIGLAGARRKMKS